MEKSQLQSQQMRFKGQLHIHSNIPLLSASTNSPPFLNKWKSIHPQNAKPILALHFNQCLAEFLHTFQSVIKSVLKSLCITPYTGLALQVDSQ